MKKSNTTLNLRKETVVKLNQQMNSKTNPNQAQLQKFPLTNCLTAGLTSAVNSPR